MNKMHVKRGDTVVVIAGKDKGKEGNVVAAFPEQNKVIVEGVAVAKKHQKARMQGQASAIIEKEMPIDASNVMRVCPKCGKPSRVGVKIFDDGSKAKYCKKCGETFND